jgi:hypothetical protein
MIKVAAPLRSPEKGILRYLLGALLAFGAVNAFGGGYYGLAGAEGVPTAWLSGSPFSDYTLPSLILFVVVGGAFLVAAVAVLRRARAGRLYAMAAAAIVLGWIAAQVAIIGYVSWMQPVTTIGGVLILLLARALPKTPSEEFRPSECTRTSSVDPSGRVREKPHDFSR